MENKKMLEHALLYGKLGWKVFPCHSIRKGTCSCGNESCKSPGKHPRTENGFKDATNDLSEIRSHWTRFPDANIGGATGNASGFVVLDLDTKHGKSVKEILEELKKFGYDVPPTICSDTGEYSGNRGTHFLYKASSREQIESTVDILEKKGIKGVDVRGDKGYVILPPSNHMSGVEYEWKMSPFDAELCEVPQWLIDREKSINETIATKDWESIFSSDVLEGMRNNTATQVAGKLLQAMPIEAWSLGWELFRIWNDKLSKPLHEKELKKVWKSIEKMEKASRKKREEEESILDILEPRSRIAECPLPEKPISFDEWSSVISGNFPDLHFAAETALAVICQFLIKDITNPFALVLVDVPSSGKTITINFYADAPELTYATDKFTPASFVSSAANVSKEDLAEIDLLPRIQYRMFMIRDFATIFSKRDDDLNEILGILTRVLDGEGLNVDSGVHGQREYSGEYLFMVLAASTPIPPRVMKLMGTLGSRLFFLKINSKDKSEEELAEQIVDLSYKDKEKLCRNATRDRMYTLWNTHKEGIEWDRKADDKNLRSIIARCAMLLARLRGVINLWHDDFNEQFKYITPVVEKPDRLNQLFYNLARGHAVACGRTQIDVSDLQAVVQLCIDGAPSSRATLFSKLIEYGGTMSTSQVEHELNCSKPTALKEMKILEILKIVTQKEGVNQDNEITLVDDVAWFLSEECNAIRNQ